MPNSFPFLKSEFKQHLIQKFPSSIKILDVGPGAGSYSKLLKYNFENIDCVEVFEPYVKKYKLDELYNKVHIENIVNFDIINYDYIIMGDILEHLTVSEAKSLISRIHDKDKKCMVAVPYLHKQGKSNNNIYEEHLQSDLTHELFLNRYPQMNCLFKIDLKNFNAKGYGYYINY